MDERTYLPLVVVLIAVVLAGCSGSGRLSYETPEEAFQKGKAFYDEGKYTRAIEYFQAVFDFGRATQASADAQLYLARSYRENEQYLLAASEYTRFLEIYRSDVRVPQAEFERAMTYYERSPRYQLDQTSTEQGIQYFQLFMNRYPDHELRPVAEERMQELREKLAHKQYESGQLYERRELYEAAALSYERTFDRYPDTPWADDALLGAIRSYIAFSDQSVESRRPERLQRAIDNYQRLVQIFPDSPLLKSAEALYEQATERLEGLDPSSAPQRRASDRQDPFGMEDGNADRRY